MSRWELFEPSERSIRLSSLVLRVRTRALLLWRGSEARILGGQIDRWLNNIHSEIQCHKTKIEKPMGKKKKMISVVISESLELDTEVPISSDPL